MSGNLTDSFKTTNNFYGTNFGVRASYGQGPFSAQVVGRPGVGANNEIVNVSGRFSSVNFRGGFRSGPAGVFAQPSNEGRISSTRFAVVPEIPPKPGYDVTPNMQFTPGYDFIFESNVIRPDDQIDRNTPKGRTFSQGGEAVSTTSPARLFRSTSCFAHGIDVAVAFRF